MMSCCVRCKPAAVTSTGRTKRVCSWGHRRLEGNAAGIYRRQDDCERTPGPPCVVLVFGRSAGCFTRLGRRRPPALRLRPARHGSIPAARPRAPWSGHVVWPALETAAPSRGDLPAGNSQTLSARSDTESLGLVRRRSGRPPAVAGRSGPSTAGRGGTERSQCCRPWRDGARASAVATRWSQCCRPGPGTLGL